jgi:hypothetical protein
MPLYDYEDEITHPVSPKSAMRASREPQRRKSRLLVWLVVIGVAGAALYAFFEGF